MEDSKIVALFFSRSQQAIAELSAKYGAACGRIARNILKNEQDAQECVNDTWLAAWNTIPPQSPDPLSAYIFRIVRNIATTRYHANTAAKRNSHYDVALEELEGCLAGLVSVEQQAEANLLSARLDAFLDTLDRDSRVLFVRRYWYSDSVTDLAALFRISAGNVSVRLSRIRGKLKAFLKKEGDVL